MPGLRIVLLRNGAPSPWGQAARSLFEIKGVSFQRATRMDSDPPGLLEDWTGQSSFPVVAYDDERPRSGWAEILRLLADQLQRQRAAGRRYFIGDGLSALDVYWATFANMLDPLPRELLPMDEGMRALFGVPPPEVRTALDRELHAHRDFVYRTHLRLPVEL